MESLSGTETLPVSPRCVSGPQFLLLPPLAPHPWLGVGPALHHCSERRFINRKILNTERGLEQEGWLWAAEL